MNYRKKPKPSKNDEPKRLVENTYAYIGIHTTLGLGSGNTVTEEELYKVRSDGSYNLYRSKWTYFDNYELKLPNKIEYIFNKTILHIFLVFSVIIVLGHNLFLNDIPEIFNNGYEIGSILSNLSLAYIASFIFYLIVIVRKEKQNRKKIFSVVYGLTKTLTYNGNHAFKIILKCAGKDEMDFNPNSISRTKFKEICRLCDANKINEHGRTFGMEIEEHGVNQVNRYIEKLFIYMPFLDG